VPFLPIYGTVILDRSILYQKCLSEIHHKLNCVRWEVDTPEKNEKPELAKNEEEYNCCPTIGPLPVVLGKRCNLPSWVWGGAPAK